MGFRQVLSEYDKHVYKLVDRTPGPVLNAKRSKVMSYCEDAVAKIKALGDVELTGEGFVMRTDDQLESGKGWAKR